MFRFFKKETQNDDSIPFEQLDPALQQAVQWRGLLFAFIVLVFFALAANTKDPSLLLIGLIFAAFGLFYVGGIYKDAKAGQIKKISGVIIDIRNDNAASRFANVTARIYVQDIEGNVYLVFYNRGGEVFSRKDFSISNEVEFFAREREIKNVESGASQIRTPIDFKITSAKVATDDEDE